MLLYQAIRQYLNELIAETPSLKKLPSERMLQDKFSSTRITVREALTRLEAEGIIYRQNRKGWFICPPRLRWNPVQKVNFYQLAQEQHFEANTQLIDIVKSTQFVECNNQFNARDDEEFFQICRVRSLDERPVMIEEIFCPTEQFKGLEDKELEGSITTIFNQDYGIEIDHESSVIHVTALPQDKADLLNLNSGAACLKIERKRFARDKQLVDYNIEYWVHGAIEICVDSN